MAFVPPGSCPNCGADVPRGARSCPECGSDDKSGWSDDTYLDDVDLPPSEDELARDAGRVREREFGSGAPRGWKGWPTAAVIVLLLVAIGLRFVLR